MKKAFTLVEISVVVGIIAVLVSLTLPLGFNFYRNQQFGNEVQAVLESLRRAQLKSVVQERDASYGVYFGSGLYVLFQGSSYADRVPQYDESFSHALTTGGLAEIVFSKVEGIPSVTGNVILTNGGNASTININSEGRINLE
ncbi:MAG: prepilin-type N-terminal cleavage/methylation domain-containing protein [Candidatus Nealsonbacteria bacterium]|nr:prepilin-type N-terminal cleavage/methylation domain-containing protein [Candidatus Nealsonbacteria bacterium]